MPLRLATSSYSGAARVRGAFAVVRNAVVIACGICGTYLPARTAAWARRGVTLGPGLCAARAAGRVGACAARPAWAGRAVTASRAPGIAAVPWPWPGAGPAGPAARGRRLGRVLE